MTMPQYAVIEQPSGGQIPVIHCPICGTPTNIWDDEYDSDVCPHLAFIYLFSAGEFGYLTPKFEQRIEVIKDEKLRFDNFQECLKKAGYDNKLLALEITYGGMGCGVSWNTDVYGFDFETLVKDSTEEERIDLLTCYGVGSLDGVFPIWFYKENGSFYYIALDDSESEPFESFEESLASAEKTWGETVGGFWRDIEEAEKHVEYLREQGYIPW